MASDGIYEFKDKKLSLLFNEIAGYALEGLISMDIDKEGAFYVASQSIIYKIKK